MFMIELIKYVLVTTNNRIIVVKSFMPNQNHFHKHIPPREPSLCFRSFVVRRDVILCRVRLYWRIGTLCLEGAEVDDKLGGQVCVEAIDSSDSVVDVDKLFRLFRGCRASVAFVAAFRFGRVDGSAITIDVCGRAIGGAKYLTVCKSCCGGASFWVLLACAPVVLSTHSN